MKSAVGGRDKIKRTISASASASASARAGTNVNADGNTSKSRPVACSGCSSIKRKRYRGENVVPRKWRKPAVLPCSLNECLAVDDEEEADDDDDVDGGTGSGVGQQGARQSGGSGGGVDPPIKTVESALEGDEQGSRLTENLGGDAAGGGALEETHRDDQGSDSTAGDNEGDQAGGINSADEGDPTSTSTSTSTSASDGGGGGGGKEKEGERETRHIHPCICDLSTKAQARIKAHIRKRELFEHRHAQRLESIDAELRAIEEEIARKQQEEIEQQELFGDKYEIVGKKKKRMKRSARRASMVSLGVKQVISWKRSPRIKVRHNQASNLRKNFTSYCGDRPIPLPDIKKLAFGQSPKIAVRVTKAASLRGETNAKKKQYYVDNQDKRPIFDVSPYY